MIFVYMVRMCLCRCIYIFASILYTYNCSTKIKEEKIMSLEPEWKFYLHVAFCLCCCSHVLICCSERRRKTENEHTGCYMGKWCFSKEKGLATICCIHLNETSRDSLSLVRVATEKHFVGCATRSNGVSLRMPHSYTL